MKAPINHCPYCSSDVGYYTKEQAYGSVYYNYNFDGSIAENGSMYDALSYKGGKVAYCKSCNKKLFKMNEVLEE